MISASWKGYVSVLGQVGTFAITRKSVVKYSNFILILSSEEANRITK